MSVLNQCPRKKIEISCYYGGVSCLKCDSYEITYWITIKVVKIILIDDLQFSELSNHKMWRKIIIFFTWYE